MWIKEPCTKFCFLTKHFNDENYQITSSPIKYEVRRENYQHVNSLQGFRWKFFLDTYTGYHQILMRHEGEEKTEFYIDHGKFCYQKNAFQNKVCWINVLTVT